ncbi:intracellular protein transport protein [Colletotrichum tofieldiae]|uniref:Intracellular protein transport protein n=1 Tax=Colletotrichum tofieldiae TaxID=708197 RepID=A0A161VW05_9PEZI|nr:intracellular protein transport protein [Colletotrichum tofieldiae]GKT57119.1 intracellular protein transport protein [Colletotrichum tofieldiae]GKT78848.1 intracellular protein transport protein [Colletotrichum tofieldiae]
MSPEASSNIRVFIRWHDQTVFAGEEIKCTITFKNIARDPSQQRQSQRLAPTDRPRHVSPLLRGKSSAGLTPPNSAHTRGHRSALSLNVPAAQSRSRAGSIPWPSSHPPSAVEHRSNGHKKSVSIVSIGSTSTIHDDSQSNASSVKSHRSGRGHARASSLQIVPRGAALGLGLTGPHSASPRHISSPLFNSTSASDSPPATSRSSTVPNTPGAVNTQRSIRSPYNALAEFRFPMVQSPLSDTQSTPIAAHHDGLLSPNSEVPPNLAIRSKDGINANHSEHATPAMRILSTTSMGGGTPRSSGEFYSMSNNSTETLASEYPTQPTRGPMRPPHFRRSSNLASHHPKQPESLMMGYAQIQGSFTLDGSLINLGPFEQVKRKAVVGGQGGGVIGVEPSKRDSGLLRSFGWGSISNSIGELLGAGEVSSIKDMRGIASSKSVPLLSTPQSILFVDLNLAPGEHKAFEYSFQLPKGLPPTHKGKAVKIAYNLVIGTQRAGGSKEQQVRSVEIPFRVLGSVNSHGEILGHDLMTPYIILRDQAKIKAVDKLSTLNEIKKLKAPKTDSTINEFLIYVDELLTRPRQGSSAGLLSPTAYPGSRRPSAFEDATTATDAINMAIMRSNMTSEGQQSPNRFEIARNGQRVGVVMLTRPSYRLGEVVTMAIDFTDAEIPCYAVHSCLESAERIEPHLAIRSEASIHRVTRKVHVSASEATLYSRRMVFTPTIPINATPEFITTGVSLEWKIRVEFVVPSQETELEREAPSTHPLLEEISRDERGGLVLVAVENMACESFEVAVPLRVYGAVATGLEKLERDEALEEGLVV